jgi:hypothetical protein
MHLQAEELKWTTEAIRARARYECRRAAEQRERAGVGIWIAQTESACAAFLQTEARKLRRGREGCYDKMGGGNPNARLLAEVCADLRETLARAEALVTKACLLKQQAAHTRARACELRAEIALRRAERISARQLNGGRRQ